MWFPLDEIVGGGWWTWLADEVSTWSHRVKSELFASCMPPWSKQTWQVSPPGASQLQPPFLLCPNGLCPLNYEPKETLPPLRCGLSQQWEKYLAHILKGPQESTVIKSSASHWTASGQVRRCLLLAPRPWAGCLTLQALVFSLATWDWDLLLPLSIGRGWS